MKLIKRKSNQRIKGRKTKTPDDLQKFKDLRRETKKLMKQKKKDYANKLRDSLFENSKRFWSLVKASTTQRSSPSILPWWPENHHWQRMQSKPVPLLTRPNPSQTSGYLTSACQSLKLQPPLKTWTQRKPVALTESQDDYLKLQRKKSLQASASSLTRHSN